jgi:hypothetical protein
MMANASEWAVGGHPLRLPFSATAMVGCSMNIRLPHRDGTMVNGALGEFVTASMGYEQQLARKRLSAGTSTQMKSPKVAHQKPRRADRGNTTRCREKENPAACQGDRVSREFG